jgi:hypothetical protein
MWIGLVFGLCLVEEMIHTLRRTRYAFPKFVSACRKRLSKVRINAVHECFHGCPNPCHSLATALRSVTASMGFVTAKKC